VWLDLIAVTVLASFATLGAVRGAFNTGMGLLTLVVAYGAAVLFAPVLAPAIEARLGLPELLALPLGGSVGFFGAYALMVFATALLRRIAERHGDEERSPRDRFLGGVFGAVRGGLIVLLISWLALWVDALRLTGTELPVPEVGGSTAAAVTGEVVETGLSAALSDAGAGGRVMARIAARPAVALEDLQGVLDDRNVASLRADEMFWTYVEHGNTDAAMNRAAFLRMSRDPALRGRFVALGLVDPAAADDPAIFRRDVGEVLRQVGPRLRGLRNDPELHALLEDPQVVAMVQSGDTIGLLRHAGFRSLVDRVTARSVDAGPPAR
jgi:uncharacterized membrane protein required for colicin V production